MKGSGQRKNSLLQKVDKEQEDLIQEMIEQNKAKAAAENAAKAEARAKAALAKERAFKRAMSQAEDSAPGFGFGDSDEPPVRSSQARERPVALTASAKAALVKVPPPKPASK